MGCGVTAYMTQSLPYTDSEFRIIGANRARRHNLSQSPADLVVPWLLRCASLPSTGDRWMVAAMGLPLYPLPATFEPIQESLDERTRVEVE